MERYSAVEVHVTVMMMHNKEVIIVQYYLPSFCSVHISLMYLVDVLIYSAMRSACLSGWQVEVNAGRLASSLTQLCSLAALSSIVL